MKDFVYMDAAATALKSDRVIEKEVDFLKNSYANAGRGICRRASDVDSKIEEVRNKIAKFINACANQVIFTGGSTDSLNRVVNIVAQNYHKKNMIITVSPLEHHSARLPWEYFAKIDNHTVCVCGLDKNLNIDINQIKRTDVLVVTAMSNVLGVPQDIKKIISVAKQHNPDVVTIVDAAQFVVHEKIDVVDFDCDFLCFSGHKIGGDTGVGILYIKDSENLLPDKFGGGMVNKIFSHDNIVLVDSPEKFEAGTLPITQIIGLGTALDEIDKFYECTNLVSYMYKELLKIDKLTMLTDSYSKLITFVPNNMHVFDFGVLLGSKNICIRVGNMCASWIHQYLNLDSSVRLSVGPWNTLNDADTVITAIRDVLR